MFKQKILSMSHWHNHEKFQFEGSKFWALTSELFFKISKNDFASITSPKSQLITSKAFQKSIKSHTKNIKTTHSRFPFNTKMHFSLKNSIFYIEFIFSFLDVQRIQFPRLLFSFPFNYRSRRKKHNLNIPNV